ncbi:Potassium efflux system KefA protein [Pediococcus damnosus]|uniref:Potassium efflux system KefA protein n=1 Tax=Pediococcus damnosus TaxID=51663 RepID=A0A0R2GXK1_9LACO|nr:mechanosensitive ion channel domain-containing protein [Pediococcus damnosus]AMV62392.1 Potassium efflux system KefA protein [Pediococcus damnosus]AMV67748.1 Potassium efflux system KefA protein [Pediococcus damnosus]AMV69973.1 Potassium efflux system KefA protein [Pediococcus damnosus]KJU73369.1 mechanosensitive ion channel protein MscS [Pediococcus damnosus LMG 28219]KRN44102.1 small-conductance mechanosensitive channel [Pediococcus damnosus]
MVNINFIIGATSSPLSLIKAFQNYFNSIDWEKIATSLINHLFEIVLISIFFWLLNSIGKRLLTRGLHKYHHLNDAMPSRAMTLLALVINIFHYVVLFFYLYAILSIIGVPIGTLVAGAGIISIAVGLGAQGLVSDIVNGLFILLDGQLDVGDQVTIQNINGKVTEIGLRSTQILSDDGTTNFIPNRSITAIANHSRNDQVVTIFLAFTNLTDLENGKKIIEQVNPDLTSKLQDVTTDPTLTGPVQDSRGNIGLRIKMYVANGTVDTVQTSFLQSYLTKLSENDIQIINNQLLKTNK